MPSPVHAFDILPEVTIWWDRQSAAATLSSHLVNHFFHDTARRLVWSDDHWNPWRTHIWPLSEQSPLLRLCLITIATAHIAAVSDKELDHKVHRASREASLRALTHSMNSGLMFGESYLTEPLTEEHCTEVMAAIVAVCYGDFFTKHSRERALHLRACRAAVDTGLLLQRRTGLLNGTLRFLIHEANDIEATANVFSFQDYKNLPSPTVLGKEEPFWAFTDVIHGVTAAERCLHTAHKGRRFSETMDIGDWISKLDSAKGRMVAENFSDRDNLRWCERHPAFWKLVNLNYLASLIYIFQALRSTSADEPRLHLAVSSLLENIQALTHDLEFFETFAHGLYWPAFIAGTVSRSNATSQSTLTSVFMRAITKGGLWCNHDALQFLQSFWSETTDNQYDNCNWLDYARQRQVGALSFIVY